MKKREWDCEDGCEEKREKFRDEGCEEWEEVGRGRKRRGDARAKAGTDAKGNAIKNK